MIPRDLKCPACGGRTLLEIQTSKTISSLRADESGVLIRGESLQVEEPEVAWMCSRCLHPMRAKTREDLILELSPRPPDIHDHVYMENLTEIFQDGSGEEIFLAIKLEGALQEVELMQIADSLEDRLMAATGVSMEAWVEQGLVLKQQDLSKIHPAGLELPEEAVQRLDDGRVKLSIRGYELLWMRALWLFHPEIRTCGLSPLRRKIEEEEEA